MRSRRGALLLLVAGLAAAPLAAARDRAPGFIRSALELPGIPAAILPADLTGDGRDDLVVLVAYTGWTTRSEFAPAKFDDVEGLVEVMSVVDELVDRRELRVYPGLSGDAGFGDQLAAVDLDTTVHALATGHPAEPLIAVTDSGAAAVRLVEDGHGARLTLTPLVEAGTTFAGEGRFYAELELLHDLDGDGLPELLLPTAAGWAVHKGLAAGLAAEPAAVMALPEPPPDDRHGGEGGAGDLARESDGPDDDRPAGEGRESGPGGRRGPDADDPTAGVDADSGDDDDDGDDETRQLHEVRFEVRDCSGDGRPDLVMPAGVGGGPLIYRNRGGLSFAAPVELSTDDDGPAEREIIYVGDLDGDGRASLVERTEIPRWQDPGWRQEVEEAKRPLFEYAARRLDARLTPASGPHLGLRAIGYTFSGAEDEEEEIMLPGGFQDLDGDGRQDLVAITLEFSLLPMVMRVLVVQRISLTMNFHVWCQDESGGFAEVPGLDLSGKFKLDLNNLRIRHLSQFAGDFDGDGRADFVQLGRGRKVTIHRGRVACRYPVVPDRTIRLERKLRHLGLARILDLDGDGRSDLYVVHPLEAEEEGLSIPARVDLYLSRL